MLDIPLLFVRALNNNNKKKRSSAKNIQFTDKRDLTIQIFAPKIAQLFRMSLKFIRLGQ